MQGVGDTKVTERIEQLLPEMGKTRRGSKGAEEKAKVQEFCLEYEKFKVNY